VLRLGTAILLPPPGLRDLFWSRLNVNVTLRVAVSFCVLSCLAVMKDLVMSHNQLVLFLGRLATGWKVRGSNPGEGEIFRTRSDRPWGPPALLYNGKRVFPGGEAAGAWSEQPPPSSAEVKKE
jgi:hypothetical protein